VVHACKSLAVLFRFTGGRHEKIETCFRIEEGMLGFHRLIWSWVYVS
jgi:hypothetical protein